MSSLVRLTGEAQHDLKAWCQKYTPALAYHAHSDMTHIQVAHVLSIYHVLDDALERLADTAIHDATEMSRVLSRPTASTESHS